ncbi:MAG: DMT family transporter [Eggerthellaceae bacterium]|jgi:drug/metabolite transporter (DMT)-like permease
MSAEPINRRTRRETYPHLIRGVIFAASGSILWGLTGTLTQYLTAEKGIPIEWVAAMKLILAALIFMTFCVITEHERIRQLLHDKRSLVELLAFGIFGIALTQVAYTSSIAYTNAGTAAVFERSGIVIIMFVLCVRDRRLPKLRDFICLILALVGTLLIATKGDLGTLNISETGLIWCIILACSLPCYTLIPVRALARWGNFLVTGIGMSIGGIILGLGTQPWNYALPLEADIIIPFAIVVLIGTIVAYVFYLQGVKDAGPIRTGLIGCIEPVAAMVLTATMLNVSFTPADIAGLILILIMVVISTVQSKKNVVQRKRIHIMRPKQSKEISKDV